MRTRRISIRCRCATSHDSTSHSLAAGAGFTTARAMVAGQPLPVTRAGDRGRFVLPSLGAYEVIVLDDAAARQ